MLKKVIFFWVDGRNNGWSNPLFIDEGTTTLGTPLRALNLAKLWCKMLGEGVRLTYIRESFDAIKGDGWLYEVPAVADYAGVSGKPMEQAGSVVLIKMGNAAWTKTKNLYQHAIWDTRITGGTLALPAGYNTAQTAWFDELKNGWGWKAKTGQTAVGIASAVPAPGNTLLITTDADVFPGPYDGRRVPVRVSGIASIPAIRNPLTVRPTGARTCITRRQFTNPVISAGQLVYSTYDFQPCLRVGAERAGTHKVGRPFRPQAGGRSKAR
jgi:hypothetical protein